MAKSKNYARVMHHIGGLSSKNDNSSMIRGGEDELNLITVDELPEDTDTERLFKIGALREATTDEVERYEVVKGFRAPSPEDKDFTTFTTGSEGLKEGKDNAGAAVGKDEGNLADNPNADAGVEGSEGHSGMFNGMSKGELSEHTVPELKEMAKEAGIEGYGSMNKDELLNAMTSQQG